MGNEGEGHSAFLVQGKPVSFICKHKKIWHIDVYKRQGCFSSIREELRRNERALASQEICFLISANKSSFE